MNRSMFRPGDWLLIVGGVAMLIFGLALDWAKVDLGGVSASGNNAFDYFFTGGIAWILVVAAGVIAVLLAAGAIAPGTTPWALILLLMTGLATLLMLLRLIIGGGDEAGIDLDRGVGMWVAFLAAAIALGGCRDELHPLGREVLRPHRHGQDAWRLQGREDGVDSSTSSARLAPSPTAVPLGCGLLALQARRLAAGHRRRGDARFRDRPRLGVVGADH